MSKEVRNIDFEEAEVRALPESRIIEGYGLVFNSLSKDLGGFREIILPEAVDGVLEQSDVLSLLDHNKAKGVLARSTNGRGSLKLTVDNKGVKYSFEAPRFDLGDEVLEGVRRGDIRTSSFAFKVSDGQKWEKRSDGSFVRTITKFDRILDISPVYQEAYADTSVAVRSLEEFKAQSEARDIVPEEVKPVAEENATEPIAEARAEDLEAYFAEMSQTLDELDNSMEEKE